VIKIAHRLKRSSTVVLILNPYPIDIYSRSIEVKWSTSIVYLTSCIGL